MLTTTHPRIVQFYQDHPQLDFEKTQLFLIQFLEKTLLNNVALAPQSEDPISSLWQGFMHQQAHQMHEIKSELAHLHSAVSGMESKWLEIKQDYVNELKVIVNTDPHSTNSSLLERANQQCYEKIGSLIRETYSAPSSQEHSQLIHDYLASFQQTMKEETQSLVTQLSAIDNNQRMDRFLETFEHTTKQLFQSMQQPIFAYIASSEERIHSNLSNLKHLSMQTHSSQEKTAKEWQEFTQKQATSTPQTMQASKGGPGTSSMTLQRTHIHIMLNRMFPTSEVSKVMPGPTALVTTGSYGSGGNGGNGGNGSSEPSFATGRLSSHIYTMRRPHSPPIMVESKHDETNVNTDEIAHFVELMKNNHSNGIMVSQNSGFNAKPNYHIECHDKYLLVYVHQMEYNPEKLRPAVDIIDQLSARIKQYTAIHSDDGETNLEWIDRDILDAVNQEYQLFVSQKTAIIQNLRESQRRVISQIEEFQFPALDRYLSSKYTAPMPKNGHKCDLCRNFHANNLKALAAHKRGCVRKLGAGTASRNGEMMVTPPTSPIQMTPIKKLWSSDRSDASLGDIDFIPVNSDMTAAAL